MSSADDLALLISDQDERVEAALAKNLPPGSTDVRQVGPLNRKPAPSLSSAGVEAVYTFNFFGQVVDASVMVCQLDKENGFTLVTIAPADIWDKFIYRVRITLSAASSVEDKPSTVQP